MSADNFYNVWQVEGQWYTVQGFASSEEVAFPRPHSIPMPSREVALKEAQRYAEYGYDVDETNYTWVQILDKAIASAERSARNDVLHWFEETPYGIRWSPLPEDLQQYVWDKQLEDLEREEGEDG